MDSDANIPLNIFILFVLIFANAFFAMSEIAIISVNSNRIKKLVEKGNKKAAFLVKITQTPSDFLATIQVGVTLSGLLASAVAAEKFSNMLTSKLSFIPIKENFLSAFSLIIITIILSYFTLVFGELIPKRIAMKYSEQISLQIVGIVWLFYKFTKPFVSFLSISTDGILKIFGLNLTKEQQNVTEEDIINLVDASEETGVLEQNGINMIKNIFEFEDKNISEIMTHRTAMIAVNSDTNIEDFLKIVADEGYSRIPIFKDNMDNITGIVYVKDLIPLINNKEMSNLNINDYARKPIYVPETTKCSKLLMQFQENKIHLAIVIDEYGGTSGLVTMEDLLEIIVGNIQDEYDEEGQKVKLVADNKYIFDGSVSLEEIEKIFKNDIFEKNDVDTISGFIIDRLGEIPEIGKTINLKINDNDLYILEVLEVDTKKIIKIQMEKADKNFEVQPTIKNKDKVKDNEIGTD
ncbi:MAG: hemolysin family protein [Elusimicrobiota bacterium]|jgi:putative hemolysin|nr:hemolysin family protein [Elusimicrobiota bacterium]